MSKGDKQRGNKEAKKPKIAVREAIKITHVIHTSLNWPISGHPV